MSSDELHVWAPGDMAQVIKGCSYKGTTEALGMYCIVESYVYQQDGYDGDGNKVTLNVVDITIALPDINRADTQCLKYIPPDEWPEVFRASKPVEETV